MNKVVPMYRPDWYPIDYVLSVLETALDRPVTRRQLQSKIPAGNVRVMLTRIRSLFPDYVEWQRVYRSHFEEPDDEIYSDFLQSHPRLMESLHSRCSGFEHESSASRGTVESKATQVGTKRKRGERRLSSSGSRSSSPGRLRSPGAHMSTQTPLTPVRRGGRSPAGSVGSRSSAERRRRTSPGSRRSPAGRGRTSPRRRRTMATQTSRRDTGRSVGTQTGGRIGERRKKLRLKSRINYDRRWSDENVDPARDSALFLYPPEMPTEDMNLPAQICKGVRQVCRYKNFDNRYRNFIDDGSEDDEYTMELYYK